MGKEDLFFRRGIPANSTVETPLSDFLDSFGRVILRSCNRENR
jgi:hypothetical protein